MGRSFFKESDPGRVGSSPEERERRKKEKTGSYKMKLRGTSPAIQEVMYKKKKREDRCS